MRGAYAEYLALAFFPSTSLFLFFFFFCAQTRYYVLPAKLSRAEAVGATTRRFLVPPRGQEREKRKNNGRPRERNSNCDPWTIDTRCMCAYMSECVCECARLIDRPRGFESVRRTNHPSIVGRMHLLRWKQKLPTINNKPSRVI